MDPFVLDDSEAGGLLPHEAPRCNEAGYRNMPPCDPPCPPAYMPTGILTISGLINIAVGALGIWQAYVWQVCLNAKPGGPEDCHGKLTFTEALAPFLPLFVILIIRAAVPFIRIFFFTPFIDQSLIDKACEHYDGRHRERYDDYYSGGWCCSNNDAGGREFLFGFLYILRDGLILGGFVAAIYWFSDTSDAQRIGSLSAWAALGLFAGALLVLALIWVFTWCPDGFYHTRAKFLWRVRGANRFRAFSYALHFVWLILVLLVALACETPQGVKDALGGESGGLVPLCNENRALRWWALYAILGTEAFYCVTVAFYVFRTVDGRKSCNYVPIIRIFGYDCYTVYSLTAARIIPFMKFLLAIALIIFLNGGLDPAEAPAWQKTGFIFVLYGVAGAYILAGLIEGFNLFTDYKHDRRSIGHEEHASKWGARGMLGGVAAHVRVSYAFTHSLQAFLCEYGGPAEFTTRAVHATNMDAAYYADSTGRYDDPGAAGGAKKREQRAAVVVLAPADTITAAKKPQAEPAPPPEEPPAEETEEK